MLKLYKKLYQIQIQLIRISLLNEVNSLSLNLKGHLIIILMFHKKLGLKVTLYLYLSLEKVLKLSFIDQLKELLKVQLQRETLQVNSLFQSYVKSIALLQLNLRLRKIQLQGLTQVYLVILLLLKVRKQRILNIYLIVNLSYPMLNEDTLKLKVEKLNESLTRFTLRLKTKDQTFYTNYQISF